MTSAAASAAQITLPNLKGNTVVRVKEMAELRWPGRLTVEETRAEVERLLAAGRSRAWIAVECQKRGMAASEQTVGNWLRGKTRGPKILKMLK